MKKIFLIVSSLSLLFLSSCNDDDTRNDHKGIVAFQFVDTTSNLGVDVAGDSFVDVEVGVTSKSGADRTFSISVDPGSDADPSQYTIDSSSLVIPAGEYKTKIRVYGNFDNIPETGSSTLILNLDTDDVIAGKGTHTMSIFRACNTDLAGMYSVTTTYLAHDFLPDFSTHTMEVQIFALSTANTYRILDFSGGLYSVGPYVAAYGTAGHASLSHIFTVNCGEVSWTNETDPWGPVVADGQNTYDPETGVITISWLCSAYGEAGVSVYTPL